MDAEYRPFSDPSKPGRLDVNGVQWWACDPYPTWFWWERVEGEPSILHTNHDAAWADGKGDRWING